MQKKKSTYLVVLLDLNYRKEERWQNKFEISIDEKNICGKDLIEFLKIKFD